MLFFVYIALDTFGEHMNKLPNHCSLNLKRIISLGIFYILISFDSAALAERPPLSGSMGKFQLTRIDQSNIKATSTVSWEDTNGEKVSLADFKGKVVFLNFWATWCSPCIRELPSIERLQNKFSKNDFAVIAISLDRGGKKVAGRLLERLQLKKLALYTDKESKSAKKLGVKYMPTTIIFDRKNRELGKLQGGVEWDSKNAVALIKYFINNPNHLDMERGFK